MPREAVHSTALDQFVPDDFGLLYVALGGLLLDEVGEEEGSQHGEHDEELDEYHQPQLLTQCHAPKTIIVKVERAIPKAFLVHSYCNVYNVQM